MTPPPKKRWYLLVALPCLILASAACADRGPGGGAVSGREPETGGDSGPANADGARSGQIRVIFFGDSITEAGERPGGYVALIRQRLRDLYPGLKLKVMSAGVSGNTVQDLQRRFDRDVLSKAPTHVVVFIGVNDVGRVRFAARASEEDRAAYREGLLDLVTRIRQSGARPFLCTPAVFGEDVSGGSRENRMLDEYAAMSRQVAAETGTPLCDLREAFVRHLQVHNPSGRYQGVLTRDGVHLNEKGNALVAAQILRVLDFSEKA